MSVMNLKTSRKTKTTKTVRDIGRSTVIKFRQRKEKISLMMSLLSQMLKNVLLRMNFGNQNLSSNEEDSPMKRKQLKSWTLLQKKLLQVTKNVKLIRAEYKRNS